MLHSSEI
jgi:hypothetical protein